MEKRSWSAGIAFCFLTVVIYGLQFPIAGMVMKQVNPFDFTAIRYGFATCLFTGILAVLEGKAGFRVSGYGMRLWAYGSCGFAGYSFLVFSGQRMLGDKGAFVAAVMMALMPLMTAVVQRLRGGARLRGHTILAMIVALFGVMVVITNGHIAALFALRHSLVADLLILLGALMWVLYTVGGSRFPDWSPVRYSTLSTLFGMTTVLAITLVLHAIGAIPRLLPGALLTVKWPLVYMIVCAGVIALYSWNTGNRKLGPANSVLFMNLIPITTLVANHLQGMTISTAQWVGAGIVVAALVTNNLLQRVRPTKSAPAHRTQVSA